MRAPNGYLDTQDENCKPLPVNPGRIAPSELRIYAIAFCALAFFVWAVVKFIQWRP